MRWFTAFLVLFTLLTPALAEQVVERNSWRVLSFDLPELKHLGTKDGKVTRASFGRAVGDGDLKVTVLIRSWIKADTFESSFREEKERMRASGDTRLRPEAEVPGADKVLCYTASAPFDAEIVVLYTKDFRCQLTVTGTKQAKSEVEATYLRLLSTLSMKGRSVISPVRVEP